MFLKFAFYPHHYINKSITFYMKPFVYPLLCGQNLDYFFICYSKMSYIIYNKFMTHNKFIKHDKLHLS